MSGPSLATKACRPLSLLCRRACRQHYHHHHRHDDHRRFPWFVVATPSNAPLSVATFASASPSSPPRRRRRRGDVGPTPSTNRRGRATFFMDRARIRVSGGAGGRGSLSYRRIGKYKRRADGGHGGNGGDVVIVADRRLRSCLGGLVGGGHSFQASAGGPGGPNMRHGRNGKDVVLRVPCGVVVKRLVTTEEEEEDWEYDDDDEYYEYDDDDQEDEDEDEDDEDVRAQQSEHAEFVNTGVKAPDGMYHWSQDEDDDDEERRGRLLSRRRRPPVDAPAVVVADLDAPDSFVVVADGGRGGTGNGMFADRRHHETHRSRAAERAVPRPGATVWLELELRAIADVGLVGFPNAGKSSTLRALSRARPTVAPYPFTTLRPVVGRVEYRDGLTVRAADLPGLVEGASEGRGRGTDFLRHAERARALLYVLDGAGDGPRRSAADDLRALADELAAYDAQAAARGTRPARDDDDAIVVVDGGPRLTERPAIVAVNKLDLLRDEEEREEVLYRVGLAAEEAGLSTQGREVVGISAGVTGEGLATLSKAVRETYLRTTT